MWFDGDSDKDCTDAVWGIVTKITLMWFDEDSNKDYIDVISWGQW